MIEVEFNFGYSVGPHSGDSDSVLTAWYESDEHGNWARHSLSINGEPVEDASGYEWIAPLEPDPQGDLYEVLTLRDRELDDDAREAAAEARGEALREAGAL